MRIFIAIAALALLTSCGLPTPTSPETPSSGDAPGVVYRGRLPGLDECALYSVNSGTAPDLIVCTGSVNPAFVRN